MVVLRSPLRSPLRSLLYSPLAGKLGGDYTTEAAALFTRFTTPPTDARKALIDALIVSLKNSGVWAKLDALYLTAAADAQAAQQNWITNAYNLTPQNSPTFTADRGYAGNGSSAYLDTGFNPTTAVSPKFVQDSGHVSGWNRTSRAAANTTLVGARQSTTRYIDLAPRIVGDLFIARLNSGATALSVANTASSGHFIDNRRDSISIKGYINGSLVGTTTVVGSISPPNANVLLLARSLNGGSPDAYSSDEIAAASVGSSLTDGDATALYGALNTYLAAVGAV